MTIEVGNFAEARRRLESKDRSLRDKRTDMTGAAALVHDGDHIAIGGCLYSRTPMALLLQLLRDGRQDVTLSRSLMCYEGELFLVAGAARDIVTSWMGLGLPWGISKILRAFVEKGRARYEEWSHLALGLRYKAAAMGMPFLPTTSMLGSDLLKYNSAYEMHCPFTGEKLCLVPAYFPDAALIHVHRADHYGNAQIDGYEHMDPDIARAAHTVIVTAEKIVAPGHFASEPDRVALPHFLVDAVVEAPFGSYPHECYGMYDADFDHFDEYVGRVKADGEQGVRSYLDDYVFGAPDHQSFLDRFSVHKVVEAQRSARELVLP
ncbi:MAG: CoA transferase subunit A [Actinomycetota bacterium]|nr:CoA transferase subunit A [Actinomycetota bacterium]